MVIPLTKPAVPRQSVPGRLGSPPRRRPRVPVPIRVEPESPPAVAASIFPSALQLLLKALPPEARLPLELLAPLVVQRTPLANATLMLWAYLLKPEVLEEIFRRHRGRSFEQTLSFATFVELIRDALVLHKGSGLQSFQRAQEQGELPTSLAAAYGKLRRIPIELSAGFFEEVSERIRPLLPTGHAVAEAPASLAGMTVVVLDGKQIKKVAKRLKVVRAKAGKLIGGKVLVAYLPGEGLAVAMAADPEGEANDIRLLPEAVLRARARIAGIRLWVADRQFCDLDQPRLLTEGDDHFLVRRSLRTGFHVDPGRPARESVDARGRKVIERWGYLGSPRDARRRYVRQIHLIRPGEEEVLLVTDLTDEVTYPADDLLGAYLQRWGIERVYQQITEVFHLERLIGSTPEGSVFQASFCLVLYNLLQVIRAYVAAGQPELPVDLVSVEQIFTDVQKELTALTELFAARTIAGWFAEDLSRDELVARLAALLGTVWTPRYRKAVDKKPRPKVKKAKCSGAHTSVHKVLEEERRKKSKNKNGTQPNPV
jgi:Transposase DDE domain